MNIKPATLGELSIGDAVQLPQDVFYVVDKVDTPSLVDISLRSAGGSLETLSGDPNKTVSLVS